MRTVKTEFASLEDFIAGRPVLITKTGYENMDMEEL